MRTPTINHGTRTGYGQGWRSYPDVAPEDIRAVAAELRLARAIIKALHQGNDQAVADAMDAYAKHCWANAQQVDEATL